MLTKARGLVLRAVDVGESDRILTVFTEEYGILTAVAKGARSLRSRHISSTTLFSYSSFVLYQKGDMYWIRESELENGFFGIREDLVALALASYVADVVGFVATSQPDPELLRLALNTLFVISEKKHDPACVKAAFEWRIASVAGFMPEIISCAGCGRRDGEFFLDVMGGQILCPDCRASLAGIDPDDDGHERHLVCILSSGAKVAAEYATHAPADKLFSFRVEGEDRDLFSRAGEEYLLNHLESSFKTLDFYKEVTSS